MHMFNFLGLILTALGVNSLLKPIPKSPRNVFRRLSAKQLPSEEAIGDDKSPFSDASYVPPRLSHDMLEQMQPLCENKVMEMAINTCAYYMEEFMDTIKKDWMLAHKNFERDQLKESDWNVYLESMIVLNQLEVQVIMSPPPSFLRDRNATLGSNMKVAYMQSIEPRKIANQLLQVMESVGKEIVDDLRSIRTENLEVIRFASSLIQDGHLNAEKSRKLSRFSDGGTPYREKNYFDMNLLVTNLALELLKNDLSAENTLSSMAALDFLNEFVQTSTEIKVKDPIERLQEEKKAVRKLLEQLYIRGLQGIVTKGEITINVLKLAQMLMEKRSSVAHAVSFIVMNQISLSRPYYKMIKDLGGFKKLDLSGRPKYSLIDLNEVQKKEEEEYKRAAELDEKRKMDAVKEVKVQQVRKVEESDNEMLVIPNSNAIDKSGRNEEDVNIFDLSPSSFGDTGPNLM